MEEMIHNLVRNTLKKENAENIISERISWYEMQIKKKQEVLDKIKEIVNEMPYLWYVDEEIERIDGTIELKYKEYDTSKLEELLEEIE